jgi:hypothetical protein
VSDLESQIFDAERDGTAPSRDDQEPNELDEDRDYDDWAAPCEYCHMTKQRHTPGCPNGNTDDTAYEIAKDTEMGL